jgi:PAS domain S-box-containing protein
LPPELYRIPKPQTALIENFNRESQGTVEGSIHGIRRACVVPFLFLWNSEELLMADKPTYEELEQRVKELEKKSVRRQAERVLRESEDKYKTLIEGSLTGIFIHQDGKYVFVNDRFAKIHGYEPKKLIGTDPLELIVPDERDAFRRMAQKRLEGATVVQQYEVQRIKKDGTTIWCEMMATRIEYKGKPAIMGNIIDITKRKQAEKALRETGRQLYEEEKRMELLQFANDVALQLMHDLRNPLVTIGGFSKRLSANKYPEEKVEQYTKIIFEESVKLDNVLKKVLSHLKSAADQA